MRQLEAETGTRPLGIKANTKESPTDNSVVTFTIASRTTGWHAETVEGSPLAALLADVVRQTDARLSTELASLAS